MKTLPARTPHVLLVAAMSSSALLGAATSAGAAQSCDPATADCDAAAETPATILSSLTVFADKVTVVTPGIPATMAEPAVAPVEEPVEAAEPVEPVALAPEELCGGVQPWVLDALANLSERSEAIRAAQPRILEMLNVLYPQHACVTAAPDDGVTGSDLELIVGRAIETGAPAALPAALPAEVAAPAPAAETVVVEEAPATVEDGLETTTTGEVRTAAADEGGVLVEEVAPEQVEVVGPQTAATGALPQTGGNGSTLAVLGLAMVASGAAVRFVARD